MSAQAQVQVSTACHSHFLIERRQMSFLPYHVFILSDGRLLGVLPYKFTKIYRLRNRSKLSNSISELIVLLHYRFLHKFCQSICINISF